MPSDIVEKLLKRGIRLPDPEAVQIADDVDGDRISGGVVLHAGTRLSGPSTLILEGAQIGREGPAVLENCFVGPEVHLGAGYFRDAVFLGKNRIGAGAHFREGTIFEEEASAAHSVGLKQTILFPFVTLGSLINFCDCLMAGGTSRKNHSEVGSNFIHFNFTPNQDKATPTLIGDVPRGVMLRQNPIFLGGQGGIVGPLQVEYGTVTASGTILRKDVLEPGLLVYETPGRSFKMPMTPGLYRNIRRTVRNNLRFIANLWTLLGWYRQVRSLFLSEQFPAPLLEGLTDTLEMGIRERVKRMGEMIARLPESLRICQETAKESPSPSLIREKRELIQCWPELESMLMDPPIGTGDEQARDAFLQALQGQIQKVGKGYLAVIQSLSPEAVDAGTRWLQHQVNGFQTAWTQRLPSFRPR